MNTAFAARTAAFPCQRIEHAPRLRNAPHVRNGAIVRISGRVRCAGETASPPMVWRGAQAAILLIIVNLIATLHAYGNNGHSPLLGLSSFALLAVPVLLGADILRYGHRCWRGGGVIDID